MKKRFFATTLAALLAASGLAGLAACGGDSNAGFEDNTGETMTEFDISEAPARLSAFAEVLRASNNAQIEITEESSEGDIATLTIKYLDTGEHLYSDEEGFINNELLLNSCLRDEWFYTIGTELSGYENGYTERRRTGFMMNDSIENMRTMYWKGSLEELTSEQALRAYYGDTYYNYLLDRYKSDAITEAQAKEYIRESFIEYTYRGGEYAAKDFILWNNHSNWYEVLKLASAELEELEVIQGTAKASEHMLEISVTLEQGTETIKLIAGAGLKASDFGTFEDAIDEDIVYVDPDSIDGLASLPESGTANLQIAGNGYYGYESGGNDMLSSRSGHLMENLGPLYSYWLTSYNGIITPNTMYDPENYFIPSDNIEIYKNAAEETGRFPGQGTHNYARVNWRPVTADGEYDDTQMPDRIEIELSQDERQQMAYGTASWLNAIDYNTAQISPEDVDFEEIGLMLNYSYYENELIDGRYRTPYSIDFDIYIQYEF